MRFRGGNTRRSAWRSCGGDPAQRARALDRRCCLRLGYVIITIGVLDFLGLGLPPPDPDWGGMINETRQMAWCSRTWPCSPASRSRRWS